MPFDVRDFPGLPPDERAASRGNRRLVACWLFAVCAAILIMVVLGGVTRLTGSGLSIMEWAPVRGVLPPLNHADWERLFALYQQTAQYQLVNNGFGLEGFKQIFWLEWAHRFWGRLIGVIFILPFIWFWATGWIERRLRGRLALIFGLGALQGGVGWFMVASGFFPDVTRVAPMRLVIHLTLALLLYGAVLWTGLDVLAPTPRPGATGTWRLRGLCLLSGMTVVAAILAGGLVAGTHAGFEYNTFPLMEGRLVPANYARLAPIWRNLIENPAAVQFDHRLLASLAMLWAALTALAAYSRREPAQARIAASVLAFLLAMQYALGIAALIWVVPVPLAAAHQANGILALTAVLVTLHLIRPVPRARGRAAPARAMP